MSIAQVWHTAKHLRTRQIVNRLSRRVRQAVADCGGFYAQRAPAFPGCPAGYLRELPPPHLGANTAADIAAGRMTFLNRSAQVSFPPRWDASNGSRLWNYNLHYFDWLWALDFRSARAAAMDWIARHPLGRDATGWEPYPLSLRIGNWCGVFFGRFRHATLADNELREALWRSLWLQGQWLARSVETHLLANHVLENAAALTLLGRTFAGKAARRWWRLGSRVLQRELEEQILADGGHFERSPMYHSRVLGVLLTLAAAGCGSLDSQLHAAAVSMARALGHLTHPDGQIALLNDSAMNICPAPESLLRQAARLGLGVEGLLQPATGPFALPQTGYYGYRGARGDYIVCDAAAIGPDYNPGHAHGDIFSFEMSLGGARVIVDSGVHDYESGHLRRYCRSTQAHNTVEIARQDQCEFWGAFRVARRGQPRDVAWRPHAGGFSLTGWHDAYCRLPGSPRHQRQFTWHDGGVLVLRDRVTSRTPVAWVSRLHLHPDCRVVSAVGGAAHLQTPAGPCCIRFEGPGELRVKDSTYCPQFGLALPNRVLEFRTAGACVEVACCIARAAAAARDDAAAGRAA